MERENFQNLWQEASMYLCGVCTYVYTILYLIKNKKMRETKKYYRGSTSSSPLTTMTTVPKTFLLRHVILLIKATASKVVGDDHISHGVKDELDVLGVSCTSHVAINFCGV